MLRFQLQIETKNTSTGCVKIGQRFKAILGNVMLMQLLNVWCCKFVNTEPLNAFMGSLETRGRRRKLTGAFALAKHRYPGVSGRLREAGRFGMVLCVY